MGVKEGVQYENREMRAAERTGQHGRRIKKEQESEGRQSSCCDSITGTAPPTLRGGHQLHLLAVRPGARQRQRGLRRDTTRQWGNRPSAQLPSHAAQPPCCTWLPWSSKDGARLPGPAPQAAHH